MNREDWEEVARRIVDRAEREGGLNPSHIVQEGERFETETLKQQVLHVGGVQPGHLFSGSAIKELADKLLDYQRDGGRVILGVDLGSGPDMTGIECPVCGRAHRFPSGTDIPTACPRCGARWDDGEACS